MAYNGSGTFVRTTGSNTGADAWNQDNLDGINIITANHDTHDQDIANGLTLAVTRDGQGKMAADFAPSTDDARDLGTASLTWRNINAKGTMNFLDGVNDGARFYNASNYVELRASSSAITNYVMRLPAVQGGASTTLLNDGSGNLSWTTANTGDVQGPASSVTGNVPSFNGTTGKIIQDSGKLAANLTTASSNITAGNLVYGSDGAKGVIGLASGTSGQILQSATTGNPPTWVNRSDGRVLISATALNGTTTTVITTALGTTYDMFEVVLEDIVASAANSTATIDFTKDAGSNWTTPTFIGYDIDGTPAATSNFMDDIDQSTTANINHCIVNFSRLCRSSSVVMAGKYDYFNATKRITGTMTAAFGSGSTVNGFRIVGSSNLTGNVYLYGFRKS